MTKSPERTIVRAIIPHPENPALHLRDPEGRYPAAAHEQGTETHEQTLHRLGREVLGTHLGIKRRAPEHEDGKSTVIAYEAKPLALPAPQPLQGDYDWR